MISPNPLEMAIGSRTNGMPLFPPPARKTPKSCEVGDFPELIRDASSHCRAHAQRAVNLDEVVREVV